MERYLRQLLQDIRWARDHVPAPWWQFIDVEENDERSLFFNEDIENAPRKSLEELTGLQCVQLPPPERLTPRQLHRLLNALKELLSAYNCHVIFQQPAVPEALQYTVIRNRFDQAIPQLRAGDYFFSFCDPGQDRSTCSLGDFCECAFLEDILSCRQWQEEDEPGEPGSESDFHEYYLRRKYGPDWERHRYYFDWEESDEDYSDEEDGARDDDEEW